MTSDQGRAARKPADDLEFADPGLAAERTRMAWTRSAISFAAIGVAILKDRPLIGAPLLVFSVAVWSVGRAPRLPGTAVAVVRRRALLVTLGVNVMAAAGLVIVLLGHSSHGLRL